MASVALVEIESRLPLLSTEERLRLISLLAQGLRTRGRPEMSDDEFDALAADPDIQREIKAINEEFACTEMDGLENL